VRTGDYRIQFRVQRGTSPRAALRRGWHNWSWRSWPGFATRRSVGWSAVNTRRAWRPSRGSNGRLRKRSPGSETVGGDENRHLW